MTMVRAPRTVAEINITPLIDVMLVLLILFMLVAPGSRRGLDVALPQPAPPRSLAGPAPLVLEIDAGGMRLAGRPIATLTSLAVELDEQMHARADRTLLVRAHAPLAYGRVVAALDVARSAGVQRIGILSSQH
jgi:biopolymer transport protein ExbD